MSSATLIMVVLICVGSAAVLAGLGVAAYRGIKLMKSARAAGIKSKAQAQQIAGRVQRLGPRIREIETKQRAVADKLASLSSTAQKSD
jgi:hypothetical protein